MILAVSALGYRSLRAPEDGGELRAEIGEVVRAERDAARSNDVNAFLALQDWTVAGWLEYQREAFDRDRPLNEQLGEVHGVQMRDSLAFVTLSLTGARSKWATGALYRRVRGRWRHTTLSAAERGERLQRQVEGFGIEYYGWDSGRIDELAAQLRSARGAVERLLGPVSGTATVHIHPAPQYLPKITSNTVAVFDAGDNSIHVLSPYYWPRPEGQGYLPVTLTHEYTHFAVDRIVKDRAPTWLHEGVAVLASGEWEHVRLALPGYIEAGEIVPLEDLNAVFGSSQPVRAYVTSAGMVDYLTRYHGKKALIELLVEIGNGRGVDPALKAVAGMDSATLYERWLREAQSAVGT